MTIIVTEHLMRKSTMRDINGNIINLIDEATGGYIIRNRQVVDQERWEELQKIERDKQEAAKAITQAVGATPKVVAERNGGKVEETKVEALEKKVEGMESKLDKILKALEK